MITFPELQKFFPDTLPNALRCFSHLCRRGPRVVWIQRVEWRMKTTILEVGGMLSVLDHGGVEKRLKGMPGVHAAWSTSLRTPPRSSMTVTVEELFAPDTHRVVA
jgi:hypothetical protein